MTTIIRKRQRGPRIGKRLKRRRSTPKMKSLREDYYLSPEYADVPQIPDEFHAVLKNGRALSDAEDKACTDAIWRAAFELRKRMERLNRTGPHKNELGLEDA